MHYLELFQIIDWNIPQNSLKMALVVINADPVLASKICQVKWSQKVQGRRPKQGGRKIGSISLPGWPGIR